MKTLRNDKILDCLSLCVNPKVRQLTLEGTIRSSKTVTGIEGFFWRVFFSKERRHLVASNDMDTLNENLLMSQDLGLLRKFRKYCSDLKKDKIGGYYIEVDSGRYGVKKISLCGYANKSKWKKVLGGTLDCILIDEANIADPQFINECYSRQVSCDHPFTLYTLNGDVPTASIYEHINCSKPIGHVPASILADMDKFKRKDGYYYMHWTMADNPIMTPEKIAKASEIYPVNSFYYKIKILGERGTPTLPIFIDYIDEARILKKLRLEDFHSFVVSMDVGATRAKNSITLSGFDKTYSVVGMIEQEAFLQCGYAEKTQSLIKFIEKWKRLGSTNIECIVIDSAEQNYIKDLKAEFRRRGFPEVIGSYKATIKDRIDLNIVLLSRNKLLVNDTENGRAFLSGLKQAVWVEGEEGKTRKDENEEWNDRLDSFEYGETRHMNALLQSAKRI